MKLLGLLTKLFLVLALLAGGLPSGAEGMHSHAPAPSSTLAGHDGPPCHVEAAEADDAPADGQTEADCCGQGDCGCPCSHAAHAIVAEAPRGLAPAHARSTRIARSAAMPDLVPLPAIRPPIA
ncbi:CopL family metal-binding regulatory protein [Arenimonas sp. MALMAid1274]|uniref:CopL family metal-binding regulatory protein n=1 Tax=Arenimonas sp. MALMAid1274 TaxID=3411630 RepID=UPI003B9F768E